MREWTIREEGYEEEKAAALGNRYLTGNGYLGIRGTLEEYEADRLTPEEYSVLSEMLAAEAAE